MDTVRSVDPVRNPYAPGAGQRPPELAGRDRELDAFDVVLERVARGRPERSLVLTGLRGVGKTVLLSELRRWRSAPGGAPARSRPGRTPTCAGRCRPRCTWRSASSPSGTAPPTASRRSSACSRRSRCAATPDGREAARPLAARHRRAREPRPGRLRRHRDRPRRAVHRRRRAGHRRRHRHRAVHRRDAGPAARRRLGAVRRLPRAVPVRRAADRGRRRPAAPARRCCRRRKSYSERLFRYVRIDRLDRAAADLALLAPAEREDVEFDADALDALYEASGGYPYFVQAYGKAAWDAAPRSPITADDVRVAAPEAEAELAVGFFGSRYERATPAEREYMRAMAELDRGPRRAGADRRASPSTSAASLVAVPGPGQPAQEGAGLLRRARPDRVHRPALRSFPPRARRELMPRTDETGGLRGVK